MLSKLLKPYTNEDYADFAVLANSNNQRLENDNNAVYALYSYEELQNGEIVDISQTQAFMDVQTLKEKETKTLEIKSKIVELEASQSRAIREMFVKPSEVAKSRLEEIDSQISELRAQLLVL